MLKFPRMPLCILLLALIGTISSAQDRAFVFPTGGSNLITVLDAADLSEQGTITATATGSDLLATPRGDRYYVVSPTPTDTIVVVDARTLNVLRRISLAVGAADAVLSPDGEYLLVSAGTLHVFSTITDQPVVDPVAVGSGPRQIVVNQTSDRAYILAASGRQIQVVDLNTFSVTTVIDTPTLSSIALLESANRLVALDSDGIRLYDVASNAEIDTIESLLPIVNGAILPIPGDTKVIVQNKGSAPNNTSQIFDVVSREVKTIGLPAAAGLRELIPINPDRAIAILFDDAALAEIDLATTPRATVTPLGLDINARNLAASPNGRFVYVSSLSESRLIRYDTELGEITHDINTPIPPRDLGAAYAPSSKPPVTLKTLSGKEQYLPPGATTRFAMAVQVLDEDNTPLFDIPVVFDSPISDEVVFDRPQPVRTNANGVAAVNATILTSPKHGGGPDFSAGNADTTPLPPPPLPIQSAAKGSVAPFDTIPITATTSGGLSEVFSLNVIRVTGINIVSGNFQITGPRQDFPESFVVFATDELGNPLPSGTRMIFVPEGAECPDIIVEVDNNGFAIVTCVASELPLGISAFFPGEMTVSVLGDPGLGSITFDFTVSISASTLIMEVVSGNGQTGRTSEPLSAPLVFDLVAPFSGIGQSIIGVEVEQIGGTGAVITPSFVATRTNASNPISVILGPAAGTVTIRVRALAPSSPSVDFMIDAIGGVPTSFETEGDQQSGRIGRTLDSPLRLRVRNELGGVIAFPVVTWEVVSGDASLLTGTDPDSATAVVSLGTTPGQIAIRATIGSLVATFNATATPPQVATISPVEGLGQVLQVGMISEPLIAEVREPDTSPAFGAFIDFSGPPNVEFLSLAPTPTVGNQLRLQADESGRAGVRVRLLGIPLGGSKGAVTSIVITASVGGGPLTSFPIIVNGRDPEFVSAGVGNAATFVPGVVPGGLATIFGTGLFEGVNGTVQAGGATTFGGTTVELGGVAAPLLAFSNAGGSEQINLQVPFGVPAGQPVNIEVNNNGSSLFVGGVPVFSTQPGVFEVPLGGGVMGGAVTDAATFQLITPQNTASPGQALALFYTGGGQISPGVGTGIVGPVPPSQTVLTAEVSVDGVPAQVTFSGYAPGFLGLYQINFVVPEGVNCGTRSLVVSIGGASSPVSTVNLTCP